MARKVIVYIGFAFAALVLCGAALYAILFIFPEMSFYGVSSVAQRNSYTKYFGPDVETILNSKNIIIESKNIDIEIRVRKRDQKDSGSIVVFEDASGISFNSLKRTQIDWLQYMVEDEFGQGVPYYKIIIREPSGVLARRGYVYINLLPNDGEIEEEAQIPYNFILNTNKSRVVFSADTDSRYLLVNNVWINNTIGTVTFPTPTKDRPFWVDIGNLNVSTSAVSVTCKTPIRGDLNIECDRGIFAFGDIGNEGDGGGNLKISGYHNTISTGNILGDVDISGFITIFSAGSIGGDVNYKCDGGSLNISECENLTVETIEARAGVSKRCNNLDFAATGIGGCTVNQIDGIAEVETKFGEVTLRKVNGNVAAITKYGSTYIEFDEEIDLEGSNFPSIDIDAFDGNVTLKNVCGKTKVTVPAGGEAQVDAHFRKVVGENVINCQGSTRPSGSYQNVAIRLDKDINPFNLTVYGTAEARNYTSYVYDIEKDEVITNPVLENTVTYFVKRGASGDYLRVYTSNKFELR